MRPPRYLRSILVLAGLLLLIVPVIAVVPAIYTIEKYFFEKDGMPYNESVLFNVTCYGHVCDGRDCRESAKNRMAVSGTVVESGNCTGYGCSEYTTMDYPPVTYSRCDLTGITPGGTFSIRNYSGTSFINCSSVNPHDIGNYYNFTPEYLSCISESQQQGRLCDGYTTQCNPTEKDCNMLSNGSYGEETRESRGCRNNYTLAMNKCPVYLKKLDTRTMTMWKDSTGHEYPAEYLCEIHVALPPDNRSMTRTPSGFQTPLVTTVQNQETSGLTFGKPAVATARYQNPVESLYCSILQLFGGRCE
jgi:hypothetical protein